MLNAAQLEFLLNGALWTLGLSAAAMLGGAVVGFAVAMARISASRIVRDAALVYVQLVQGTPVLVLMFVIYFGVPTFGVSVSAFWSVTIALTIFSSAYLGEIWRGCIESVPKQQWEAAWCLALTRPQRMVRVILPQALRIASPPTVGFLVQLVKNTSLASVVGFVELARAGQILNSTTFRPFLVYLIVAVIYFVICFPLSVLSRRLEQRGSRYRREVAVP